MAFVYSGLNPRPFLIFCFPESSPVLNQTEVRTCKYSEDLCGSPKNWTHEIRVADALSAANEAVFNYERILKDTDSPKTEFEDFHKTELNISSAYLAHIRGSKAWIDKTLNSAGIGRVQQKIRICEKNETPFRLCILSGLLVVLALAAYATYRLHKIADYRVFELTNDFPIFNKLLSRSSLTLPKPFWAAYQARKLGLFIAHCCSRQ